MIPRKAYDTPAVGSINLAPQFDEQAHLSNRLTAFLQSTKDEGIMPSMSERSYQDIRIGSNVLTQMGIFYKIEQERPLTATISAVHQPKNGRRSEDTYTLMHDQQLWHHKESSYQTDHYQHLNQDEMFEEMRACTSEHEMRQLDYMQDYAINPGKLIINLVKDLAKSAHYRKESDAYHADLTTIDNSNDFAHISSRHISIKETRTPKYTYRRLAVHALVQIGREVDVMQQISLTDKLRTKTGTLLSQDLQLSLKSHELQPAELSMYAQSSEYARSGIALDALHKSYEDLEAQTFLRAAS